MRAVLFNALWNSGRLAQHEELVRDWQRDARERGDRYASAQLTTIGLSYQIALRANKPAAAEAALQAGLNGWPATFQLPHWGQYVGRQLTALYRGDGSAHSVLAKTWPEIRRSKLLHVPYLALLTHIDAAWACLDQAARSVASERAARIHDAQQHTRALRSTRWPLADALGDQAQAQIELLLGHPEAAIPLLINASEALRQHHSVYEYPTIYLLGNLMGGDEGYALITRAANWASREGVVDAEQWFSAFVPAVRLRV